MKKLLLISYCFCFSIILQAQISKTVNVDTAGGLLPKLSSIERNTITNLTITGNIDVRDFVIIRDSMPLLKEIDITGSNIIKYTGTNGTNFSYNYTYPSNTIPACAFFNPYTNVGKDSLSSIKLPINCVAISDSAFRMCSGLQNIFIYSEFVPKLITSSEIFYGIKKSQCVLHITAGLTYQYQLVNIWNSFPNIIEMPALHSYLNLSLDQIQFTSKSNPQSVYIISNSSWSIASNQPWLELNKTNGISTDTIFLTALENTTTTTRTATLSVTADTIIKTISIIQQGSVFPSNIDVSLTTKSLFIGDSVQILATFLPVNVTDNSIIWSSSDTTIATVTNGLVIAKKEGTLTITCKSVLDTLVQANTIITVINGFNLSTNTLYFSKSTDSNSVTIISNVNWTTSSNQSWLTINKATGNGNGILEIRVDSNNTSNERTALITLTAANISPQIITVKQINNTDSISVEVNTPGSLACNISKKLLNTLTKLMLTGTIDVRDFKTMRDSMPILSVVDLSIVTITAYHGNNGTDMYTSSYPLDGIPRFAFCDNKCNGKQSLTKIVLPISSTTIGFCAFLKCSLKSINVPASIDSIGESAMGGCGNINVDAKNQKYSSSDGVLFNKTQTVLIYYPTGKPLPYKIPNTVTIIELSAFSTYTTNFIILPNSITTLKQWAFNWSGLTSITIPSSVSIYGNEVFFSCHFLTSIYSNNKTPVDLNGSQNVFGNDNNFFSQCTLYVPIGAKSAYQAANQWQNFVNIIEIPFDTIKTIATTAGQLSINIPETDRHTLNSLTLTGTIDVRDIYFIRDSLPYIKNIDLSAVTIVAYEGELDSSLLKSLMIFPANTLPKSAFKNKVSLESVVLPTTLTAIEDGALSECSNLTSITFTNSSTEDLTIVSTAFNGIDKTICKIIIPKGTESAYSNVSAFDNFTNIEENTAVSTSLPQIPNTNKSIVLYPNPATSNVILLNVDFAKVEIYNMNGILVLSKRVLNKESISLVGFSTGIYEVKIITNDYVTSKILVVK